MATTNKIVDTRKLARKGRFGDTKIRKVDGKPAHVNAWEASLIDSYGKSGESIVKKVGSGTRNQYTGLPEYHGAWYTGHPVHHQTGLEIAENLLSYVPGMHPIGTIENIGEVYETVTDKPSEIGGVDLTNLGEETSDFLTDPKTWTSPGGLEEQKNLADIEAQAGGVMTEGFGGLQQKLIDYLGGGGKKGILKTERDITRRGISRGAQSQLSELFGGVSGASGKSGFVKSAALENIGRKGTRGVMGEYGGAMDTSKMAWQKDVSDVKSTTKKTMNQMILDYQAATDKAYDESDPAYQALLAEFDMEPYTLPGGTDTGTTDPFQIDWSNTMNIDWDLGLDWTGLPDLGGSNPVPGGSNPVLGSGTYDTGSNVMDNIWGNTLGNLFSSPGQTETGTTSTGGTNLPGAQIRSWQDKFV